MNVLRVVKVFMWKACNNLLPAKENLFGGEFLHPNQLVKRAKEVVEDFNVAEQNNNNTEQQQQGTNISRWLAPPCDVYKINWDAAIDKLRKLMGVGVIVRDHEGKVMATMCSPMKYITDPTVVEAFAAWRTVGFGRDLGLRNVITEDDALEIVYALRREDPTWSMYGHLIDDAKIVLQSFHSWRVIHMKRDANKAAHPLAKATLQQSEEKRWMEEYPRFLHDIVTSEEL